VDIQKKNIMKDLENNSLKFLIVGDFFTDLKQEFGKRNNKLLKVTELKKIEQESEMMKEFVQKFRKTVRKSGFEESLLIEEFIFFDLIYLFPLSWTMKKHVTMVT